MKLEEILYLHTKPEYEQKQLLIAWEVMDAEKYSNPHQSGLRPIESLAECAFRLRDEFMENHSVRCWKEQIKELLDAGVYTYGTWTASAKPIHWIQAALLARLENEK